jgi:hypothetical protein
MIVIPATTTTLAILGYVAAIASAMLLFLVSLARYLQTASKHQGSLLTFSAVLLIFFIGGGLVWFRFLSVGT